DSADFDEEDFDEFFTSFHHQRRHLQQQGEQGLPKSFDVSNTTTKVPAEQLQTVLVRSQQHCKQMLQEVFAAHVLLSDADAVLDIAVHFTLEPIVTPLFTKLKMNHTQEEEEKVFRIED